jgi:hypothetical protein
MVSMLPRLSFGNVERNVSLSFVALLPSDPGGVTKSPMKGPDAVVDAAVF